jgi:hypothetical protein
LKVDFFSICIYFVIRPDFTKHSRQSLFRQTILKSSNEVKTERDVFQAMTHPNTDGVRLCLTSPIKLFYEIVIN